MDDARLNAADEAYAARSWEVAAREYLAAAEDGPEGSGYPLHRAGNALMRMKRVAQARDAYERALRDAGYKDVASVACNLGAARSLLGEHDGAIEAFERALLVPGYPGRHKALQGMAGAYYQTGRFEEAAEAYRRAALERGNSDPGKALNNLGMCFMKLDRPQDAVGAYRAAVDLEEYAGRGRSAANLAMAYATLGMHARAVESFDRAEHELGYELPPALDAARRASTAALVAETGSLEPIGPAQVLTQGTGTIPMVPDAEAETAFFTRTDAEMRVADREARSRERQIERSARPVWVTVLVWSAVVVAVVAGIAAAYLFGIGYPTQQMTVDGLLGAYAAGEDVSPYWVAVPSTDVSKAMASLPPIWDSYTIGALESSARTSKAEVTVTLEQGGVVTYQVSLAREGVGWRVSGISNAFNSLNGGL